MPRLKFLPSEELAIFLNKLHKTPSIASKLIIYFVLLGGLAFGLALIALQASKEKLSDFALESVLNDMNHELSDLIHTDDEGNIKFIDAKMKLKWGFDALYSNLAYRLIDPSNQRVILSSMPENTEGYILNDIGIDFPLGYSRINSTTISLYRSKLKLKGKTYYLDVARSDLLAALAYRAVRPAIVESATIAICSAFIIFLIVSFIAIRFIVKPANELRSQIEAIKPEDLDKRLTTEGIPKELLPIATAMNDTLDRVKISFDQQKRFIADAAHELRTPLTILLNRIELKIPPSDTKNKLKSDTQYLSRIVEQLLDLSRAQNIKSRAISSTNLTATAKEIISLLAPMAIDKEQQLELTGENEISLINIDKGDLSVIIKNLLENAIKHCPPQSNIRLSIFVNGFTIEDSGKGIPKEDRELIFERFWRENQSDRSGSGLGLAIIKELLDHYHGNIYVGNSSALGGALFKVTFA